MSWLCFSDLSYVLAEICRLCHPMEKRSHTRHPLVLLLVHHQPWFPCMIPWACEQFCLRCATESLPSSFISHSKFWPGAHHRSDSLDTVARFDLLLRQALALVTFPLVISIYIELNQRCLTSIRLVRPWYFLQRTCGVVHSVQLPRHVLRFLVLVVLSSSSRCVLSPIPHHGLPEILLVTHVCIDQVPQTPTSGRGDSSRQQACRSAFDSAPERVVLISLHPAQYARCLPPVEVDLVLEPPDPRLEFS
jgi:hypothetical protein